MTAWEQKLPLLILAASLLLGLRLQGRWWLPRFVWTMAIASTYTFVLFQVHLSECSHAKYSHGKPKSSHRKHRHNTPACSSRYRTTRRRP